MIWACALLLSVVKRGATTKELAWLSTAIPLLLPQVNNASVQGAAVEDLRDISRERLERTFNTNVIAMFNIVQARAGLPWPLNATCNGTSSVHLDD
jgi:hypothetical protein